MFGKLSKRNKRALLILATVVVATVFFSHVILPFYDARSQMEQRIELKRRELQSFLRLLEQRDEYVRQLERIDQVAEAYGRMLLDTQDPGQATVQVEEVVRTLAAQHGVRVTRSNPLPERKVGERYAKIPLQLSLECSLPDLVNFLHALSVQQKFLGVEEFTMASFRLRNRTRIQPRMQIVGFVRLS